MNGKNWILFIQNRLIYVRWTACFLWLSWWIWLLLASTGIIHEKNRLFTDHMAFYAAGRMILDGEGEHLYDYDWTFHYQPKLIGIEDEEQLTAFRNPPFYALLYVPTSGLPYRVSFWIWSLIAIGLFWFSLSWLGVKNRLSTLLWCTSFYPLFTVISFGQNSLLSFACFSLGYRFLQRDQKLLAGLVLGLLAFKPTLLIGVVLAILSTA